MADLNLVANSVTARTLPSSIQSTPAVVPSFQDIYQQTQLQPGLIRQIEEVGQARQAERVALEQSLGDALTSDSEGGAGESALTPLKMRAATRQLAELNVKNSLTIKTVAKTVDAFNQLARGG